MPASSAMSRVRVAAKPFCVNSFLAACMIFSSVERSEAGAFWAGLRLLVLRVVRSCPESGRVLLPVLRAIRDERDAFATGSVFVQGKIRTGF